MSFFNSFLHTFTEYFLNYKVFIFILIQSLLTLYSSKFNVFYILITFFYTIIVLYYTLPCPDILPYGFNISKGFDHDYLITLFLVFLYSIYISIIAINYYTKNKEIGMVKHIIYNYTTYSILILLMMYFNLQSNFNIGCFAN
jgi:hypothetical protein